MKRSGKGPTPSDSNAIAHQRQNIQARVDWFQSQGLLLMEGNPSKISVGNIYKTEHADDLDQLDYAGADDDDNWLVTDVEEIVEEEEPEVTPEKVVLYLPSNFTPQQRKEYGLQGLGRMEYELREGQANDSLEKLRECLAEKSLKFRKDVRLAKGQKKTIRVWDTVHRVDDQIRQAVATYRMARQAIGMLGQAVDLEKYQEITKSDLKMSGDIVEENRVGQRSSVLPWFWRLDRKIKGYCGEYEKECKYSKGGMISLVRLGLTRKPVYRVNWLRARARARRRSEEKEIVVKEMEWVIGSFRYMGGLWKERAEKMGNEKSGHRAYAMRETERWNRWAGIAKTEFSQVTGKEAFQA